MSGFGQDAWLAAGHSLLTEKIPAEAYMDVLKERQKVYSQTCGKEIPWIVALIGMKAEHHRLQRQYDDLDKRYYDLRKSQAARP
jgi:hypothetical protein